MFADRMTIALFCSPWTRAIFSSRLGKVLVIQSILHRLCGQVSAWGTMLWEHFTTVKKTTPQLQTQAQLRLVPVPAPYGAMLEPQFLDSATWQSLLGASGFRLIRACVCGAALVWWVCLCVVQRAL